VITRGQIYWTDLGERRGSSPAQRRPVLVVQADAFNQSRINTSIVVVITSNTSNAALPGNVFLPASATGLPRDSSANVSALMTLNKDDLDESPPAGELPAYLMGDVDSGLRLALDL
jgi:mRNA interferase MazF